MSIICLLSVCLFQYAHSLGSWGECEDLDKVKSDVSTIESDIRTLLQSSGEAVSDLVTIHVSSAQCQLVAGMNYKVTMDVAPYTEFIMQYFIDLPINGTEAKPSSLQMIALGYKGIYGEEELEEIKYTIDYMENDIRSLLSSEGLDVNNSSDIEVVSAESQVYGGTTYKVSINIGIYQGAIISYYVGFPFLIRGELQNNPKDLQLLDAGDETIDDLSEVEYVIDSIDADLRSLLSPLIDVSNETMIEATSAVLRAIDGVERYTVSMNVGAYYDVIISYDIGAPILLLGVPQNNPTNLQLIDAGYKGIDDLIEVEYTVQDMSDDIRVFILSTGLDIDADSSVVVVSAESQPQVGTVGTRYRVSINIGSRANVIISYYVDYPLLVVGALINNPTDFQLIDAGSSRVVVGGYNDVSDLDTIKQDIASIEDDIRNVLLAEKLSIEPDDDISVVSAQSQVVAGMNYRVTLNIAQKYRDVVVEYFVALPQDGVVQSPQDITLIDLGSEVDTSYGDNLMGSYQGVDEDCLNQIRSDVDGIGDDIYELLISEQLNVERNDDIIVVSAQSQVVAGTNYRVTMNVGSYARIRIQYFVPLPQDGVAQSPQNLELINPGIDVTLYGDNMGSYERVDDLEQVESDVVRISDDIHGLLNNEGLSVSDDDSMMVVSAQSQVVAGTNYRVTLNIGSHTGVIIQYFVDLPVNDEEQMPHNLKLIDSGTDGNDVLYGDNLAGGYEDVDDLESIKADVARIEEDIISLLLNNDFVYVTEDDRVDVISAQQQVVAGMNYRVTIDVERYMDVIIQYFISANDADQMPQNLVLIDRGNSLMQNDVLSTTKTGIPAWLIIVAALLGACLIGFMVGCVVCLNKKKGHSGGLYAELTADGTHAIDVNL